MSNTGFNIFFFILFSALMILPVWIIEYPPMTDLPQHAAQINTVLKYSDPSTQYQEYFKLNWFTPYLFGYSLILVFATVFPVLISVKIGISLALLGLPLGSYLLNKELGGKPEWNWIIFPTAMGYAFYWGFLNFIIAVPLVLFILYFTFRYLKRPSLQKMLGLILLVHFLFFSHGLLLFFTLVLCFIIIVQASDSLKSIFLNMIPYMSVIPVLSIWLFLTRSQEAQVSDQLFIGNYGLHRIIEMFTQVLGQPPIPEYILLGAVLYFIPFFLGAEFSKRFADWIPFIFCSSVFIFLPMHFFGTGFLYPRFSILLLPFFLLTLKKRKTSNTVFLQSIIIIFIIILLVIPIYNFLEFRREYRGFDRILEELEPNQRILSMIFERNSDYFQTPVYLHFPLWYQVEKEGIVDFNFSLFFPEIVRYRDEMTPSVSFNFEWNPGSFDWEHHEAYLYDYFIIRSPREIGSLLFNSKEKRVKLISHYGKWWLYENHVNPNIKDFVH